MKQKLSAASKRALSYEGDIDFYCSFRLCPVTGLESQEGIHRRDPTSVIKVGDLYYVWYTRSEGPHFGYGTGDPDAKVWPWDQAELWYATSPDGINWTERGIAVGRGDTGAYDDRSVFTPEILVHEGRCYLVYQVVQHPYHHRGFESIAMAVADAPVGPWKKTDAPILEPVKDGVWRGDEDNRLEVESYGSFDSQCVHDPCLMFYKNKFWLYYKGERMGDGIHAAGRHIMWGVAVADRPEGPYVRSEYNPVTNTGHETCLWHYRGGIAALLIKDGHEKRTIQYAPDGINFEIKAYIDDPPIAAGPFRADDTDTSPIDGIRWGLCHRLGEWNHIIRFDADEKQKNRILNRKVTAF